MGDGLDGPSSPGSGPRHPAHGPARRRHPAHAAARRAHAAGARRRRGRKTAWIVIGSLSLVLALALAWVLRRRAQAAAKAAALLSAGARAIAVTGATAQKGDIGVSLDAIGTVTPLDTASIASQVTGLVVAVHYKEGQRVMKGDPLIDIDPRPFQATLLQAQGALERDENVLAQARMDLARYRAAWARNGIAKQTLDDQEKLALQDEGTVKNDSGTVRFDQIQVDYCHIAAPIDGRVGLRLVDPGNVVQAAGSAALAVITQLEPITVVFTIPEDSLAQVQARLRAGAKLGVDVFDRTGQTKISSGTLLTLDNQIDTMTGTVKARALFDNKDGALFPNQFVNARLRVDTLRGATLIPSSAIQQNGQASFAYVIRDGVARLTSVKPGVIDAGVAQVDGVDPGDVVADSGFDKLQDGSKVVLSSGAAQAGAAGSGAP